MRASCLCGGIRIEITGKLGPAFTCHCSRCRKSRSAAHATNGFTSLDGIRFEKGEDLLVPYKLPEAKVYTPVFCKICGASMPRLRTETGTAIIPLGSLDDDLERGADDHIFTGSKAPWFTITDDLPQYEEAPPA